MSKQAVEGKRLNMFGVKATDTTVIEDPSHPLFDSEGNDYPIDEAMVQSIMRSGVRFPAIVWKDGEDLLIIDGRQRRKNTIEANGRIVEAGKGEDEILLPVVLFRGTIEEAAQLMEELNELRRENSPLVRARRFQRMIDRGRTPDEIAALLGKSIATINNAIKLLDCSAKVQRLVESGEMTQGDALKLTGLPRAAQDEKVEEAKVTAAAIAAEEGADGEETAPEASHDTKKRAPRVSGPKRTASGAVSKGTLRKIYERASQPANEEFENALTDGERLILGWALGKVPTEKLGSECPGIYLLLGIATPERATADEAPEVEIDGLNIDEDETDGEELSSDHVAEVMEDAA